MSFDGFAERWPCRDREAQQLIKLLGGNTPPPCVLVSGPRCTGKTGVTRYVVNHSGKDYAWVSALQDNTLPTVLSNAVAQFNHQRPCFRDGCGKTTESSTDLLLQLAGVRPFSKLRGVLVLDDADAMASAEGLAVLTRLQELSGANITVVLISSVPWNSGALGKAASSMALEPLEVAFCGYTNAQISQILLQQRPAAARSPELTQLFVPFLQSMLPLFLTASATVADLQVVVDFLWPRYVQPVLDGTVPASDHMRLHALAQPHLDRARTAFRVGLGAVPAEAEQLQLPGAVAAKAAGSGSGSSSTNGSGSSGGQMQWELSFLNKFLLLAAYIASQNPPDHDLQVFDPSAKAARRRRKDTLDHSRRVEAARQAKQSAGVSFSLERLLHVFWTLLELEGIPPDSPDPDREWRSMHASMHCADVLTQINTLVSLKLLARVPGEPVIADTFVCSIPEELATHIASHLSISLDHYIVYT